MNRSAATVAAAAHCLLEYSNDARVSGEFRLIILKLKVKLNELMEVQLEYDVRINRSRQNVCWLKVEKTGYVSMYKGVTNRAQSR